MEFFKIGDNYLYYEVGGNHLEIKDIIPDNCDKNELIKMAVNYAGDHGIEYVMGIMPSGENDDKFFYASFKNPTVRMEYSSDKKEWHKPRESRGKRIFYRYRVN